MNKKNNKNQNKKENEILQFIEKHGIFNKDISNNNSTRKKTTISNKRKDIHVFTVDLHGKTQDEARPLLHKAFDHAMAKGYSKLLIIHGKGNNSNIHDGPVIKNLVHSMLKNEFYNSLIDFKIASPKDGGGGATIVILR